MEERAGQTDTPYQSAGKELDGETGLNHHGARYYNPRTQLWASADPALPEYLDTKLAGGISEPRNLAAYTYAHNNPVKLVDPTGRAPEVSVYDRITVLMAGEMSVNSRSEPVQKMHAANTNEQRWTRWLKPNRYADKAAAMAAWKEFVKTGGPWDHKGRIAEMNGRQEFSSTNIPGTDLWIRDDFWSNVHYGYVGTAAGFSPEVLQGGAGLVDCRACRRGRRRCRGCRRGRGGSSRSPAGP